MFYCEKCRKEYHWTKTLALSYGKCEMCHKTARCYEKKELRKKLDWQGAIEEAAAEASEILGREEIIGVKWEIMSLEEKVELLKRRIDVISNTSSPIAKL